MRRKVRQPILPFRHPERSRGIFPVAAVYDMHAAAQKIARALISHSPFHRCARKISRFARNDNTGKAILSFSACSRRIFPLSFIPPVPYPPLQGTFPSRGRLLVHGGGILVSPPSPWEKDFGLLPPSFGRRCPEGAEVGSRSGMRRKVRQPILPFRHPERSPRSFLQAGKQYI